MKVYSFKARGSDGLDYSMRMLLEPSELAGLQAAALLPLHVHEVVGMQAVADSVVAMLEREMVFSAGARLQ